MGGAPEARMVEMQLGRVIRHDTADRSYIFLQEKGGVDGKYLAAVGYGPYRPVADNTTDEGRAENRRIEIVLTPLDASGASSGEVQASP